MTLICCSWWCYSPCCWQLSHWRMSYVERMWCWWSKGNMRFVYTFTLCTYIGPWTTLTCQETLDISGDSLHQHWKAMWRGWPRGILETGGASEEITETWQAAVGRTNCIFWEARLLHGKIKGAFGKFRQPNWDRSTRPRQHRSCSHVRWYLTSICYADITRPLHQSASSSLGFIVRSSCIYTWSSQLTHSYPC